MSPRTKNWVLAAAAALVLALGGYAIGSHAGDGPATSGPTAPASPTPGGSAASRNLTILAGKLGVTPARLRDATQKLRADRTKASAAARAKVASDLAKALGIPRAKVRAALDKPHSLRKLHAAYAQRLALLIGADAATVGPALAEQRAGAIAPGTPALATKLGVPEPKLRSAVQSLRPGFARLRRNEQIAATAKNLGIGERRLRAALKGLKGVFAKERATTRDKLAADLAKHLGIPKSRVDRALPAGAQGGSP